MLAVAFFAYLLAVASANLTDPCVTAGCPPSGSIAGFGALACSCKFNATQGNITISRDYSVTGLTSASFVWAIATYPVSNSSLVNSTFVDAANNTKVLAFENVPSAFSLLNITDAQTGAVQGTFKYELLTAGVGKENDTIDFTVAAADCTLQNVQVNGYTISWDAPAAASIMVYKAFTAGTTTAADGNLAGTSFIATEKCAQGDFDVVTQEIFQQHNCQVRSNKKFFLTAAPTTPTALVITNYSVAAPNVTEVNSTATTNLTLFPQWNVSNGFKCTDIVYYGSLSIPSTGVILRNFTYAAGDITVTDMTAVPKVNPVIAELTWDTNQVYWFNLWANTPAGNSDVTSAPFVLPGYQSTTTTTTASPSSDSGLSNTVIAGIAVGATVGVVALALIIYKCSASSRSGYSNIGGDSNA